MSYVAFGQVSRRAVPSTLAATEGAVLPVVSVPFKTKWGTTGVATVGTGPNCGSPFGLQQMLKDLGYNVSVDGIVGPNTLAAVGEYAVDRDIPYTAGAMPSGAVCAALIADWSVGGLPATTPPKTTPPTFPSLCPPGTVFDIDKLSCVPEAEPPPNVPSTTFPKLPIPTGCPEGYVFNMSTMSCVPVAAPPPVAPPTTLPSTACPEGSWGIPPMCVQVPGAQPATPTPSVPTVLPATTACPDGTYTNWPACLLPPSSPPPVVPPNVACPPGTEGTFPNCTSTKPPGPEIRPAVTEKAEAGLSTGAKVAIGIAVVGAVGAIALILAPKRAKATPNLRPSPYPVRRKSAPKKYRATGATQRRHYALPSGYSYPIHDRKHVIRAKGRFTQHKWRYSMDVRRTIAQNINKAAKRFGLKPDARP
jgi:hypothetical protein